ncbi:FG-GAP-like repeat-containing protein [Streptomyces indicus]|uniref:FG-GAP repeat-containing protein n=1 Tax=Streptomyces indicus TaxID=417292 RepID=A0A1G9EJP7_9ACTN|nr:FG-GAP-like repeat-containing protein [Streptomyces indicus]SDK76255.1 FG-GAP repeat-containing protein [Streptomyces indicus]
MKRRAWLTLAAVVASGAGIATYAVAGQTDDKPGGEALRARDASVRTMALEAQGAGRKGVDRQDTRQFSSLMLTWDSAKAKLDGKAEVRVRSVETGDWSAWQVLEVENSADGSEAKGVRGGTEPLWTGGSDAVEVRVTAADGSTTAGLPKGIDLKLIDPGVTPREAAAAKTQLEPAAFALPAEETTPPAGTPSASGEPSASADPSASTEPSAPATQSPAPSASASVSPSQSPTASPSPTVPAPLPSKVARPPIIPQSQWADPEVEHNGTPEYNAEIKAVVVHHTGVDVDNSTSCKDSAAQIRAHQEAHIAKGYFDIGYNFLVDKCGQIFEGRSGGVDLPVKGAHDYGFNTDTLGIAFLGNTETAPPTRAALDSIARIAAWRLGQYNVSPNSNVTLTSAGDLTQGNKIAKGTSITLPRVFGHRDTNSTLCPGKGLYAKLGQIRAFAARPGISHALPTTDIRPAAGTLRDGLAELVVGAPRASSGGSVIVAPGRTTGVTASGRLTLTQNSSGVPGATESGDQWGQSTAVGDVNGDGWGDLVVGAPGEDGSAGYADSGALTVLYGPGLTSGAWHGTISGRTVTGARLGSAVAAGDFDADGRADLFALGEGKSSTDGMWWASHTGKGQVSGTVATVPVKYTDATSGDFNGDGYADVAATYVRTDTGKAEVRWFKGGASGLTAVGKLNIAGGRSVVAADFNNNGYDDIVIGQPYTAESGAYAGGQVTMVYGTSTGFSGIRTLHQNTSGVPGSAESGDALGWSVSAGDYNGDGWIDLLAGAPREDMTRDGNRADAGTTLFFKGTSTGINGAGTVSLSQDTSGMPGATETNDRFGSAVSAADFTGDGKADVVVGGDGEDAGAGQFTFAPGRSTLTSVTGGLYTGSSQLGASATAHIGDNMAP